jgi:hypothetical protein
LKGCGLLANSQSCQPLATWGSALIEQDLFNLYNRMKRVLLPVIWQSSPKAVSSCSREQGETCLKLAGLRNKACRIAGIHVVSNGRSVGESFTMLRTGETQLWSMNSLVRKREGLAQQEPSYLSTRPCSWGAWLYWPRPSFEGK